MYASLCECVCVCVWGLFSFSKVKGFDADDVKKLKVQRRAPKVGLGVCFCFGGTSGVNQGNK